MKFNKIFLALTVTAALTACSSDDDLATQDANLNGMEGEIPADDVRMPIRLGVGSGLQAMVTRANHGSIEANDFKVLDSVGVFMLARYEQETNPSETPLHNEGNPSWQGWSRVNAADPMPRNEEQWTTWVDNQLSHMKTTGAPETTNIMFCTYNYYQTPVDSRMDTIAYYPTGSWYSYRFYSYFPYQPAENVEFNKNQRIVHFNDLDGKTDIIWGRSDKAMMDNKNEKYAYSARYFRQAGYAENYPVVKFKHKMMAFQFAIQGIPDLAQPEEKKWESCNRMYIDSIYIYQAPTKGHLIVADLDDLSDENGNLLTGDDLGDDLIEYVNVGGTPQYTITKTGLTPNPNTNDGKISYTWDEDLKNIPVCGWPLSDKSLPGYEEHVNGDFSKKRVHEDNVYEVGQRIMLPVLDEDADEDYLCKNVETGKAIYKIRVKLGEYREIPGGGEEQVAYEDERPLDINLMNGQFEEGKCYKIILQIAGPQQINMKAELVPWTDVDAYDVNTGDGGIKPLEFN